MSTVHRLPVRRDLFLDSRGVDRGLRVTCHPEEGLVVISLWHDDRCTGSFQLPVGDCARMIGVLATGLGDQVVGQRAGFTGRQITAEYPA
ncbi:MAG: hypothetical protein ABJA87_13700 [bacterium]